MRVPRVSDQSIQLVMDGGQRLGEGGVEEFENLEAMACLYFAFEGTLAVA